MNENEDQKSQEGRGMNTPVHHIDDLGLMPDPNAAPVATQDDVQAAFAATAPFPVEQHAHEGHDHYMERLIEVFHHVNKLDKRHQAVGLLNTISQACGMLAGIMSGQLPVSEFAANPLHGLFYQFDDLRKLFPVDQKDVLAQRDKMLDMYFIPEALVDEAVEKFAAEGVVVEAEYAASIHGAARYVLRMVSHTPPEGHKSALTVGQLMWFFDKTTAPTRVSEAEWNPYYVPRAAANDPELPEGFGDQQFVGTGAEPVIVGATFESTDEEHHHPDNDGSFDSSRGDVDESGLEREGESDDIEGSEIE